jgi:hypothetical protein
MVLIAVSEFFSVGFRFFSNSQLISGIGRKEVNSNHRKEVLRGIAIRVYTIRKDSCWLSQLA